MKAGKLIVSIFFKLLSFMLIASAPQDINDYDLDSFGIGELGSLNDIDLFKINLSLFGVDVNEAKDDSKVTEKISQKKSFPDTFINYNSITASDIVEGRPLAAQLWLFLSEKDGDFDRILPQLKPLAELFQGQLLFVVCNVDERSLQVTLKSVRVKRNEAPTMRVIFIGPESMDIYKPQAKGGELDFENVKNFAELYLAKKLTRLPAGESLPDDWDQKPVKFLVADNFQQFLDDNQDKRVAIKYYSPTCKASIAFAKIYDAVAKILRNSNSIILAEIDITKNELSDRIMTLPTMKVFEGGRVIYESNGLPYDQLYKVLNNSSLDFKNQKNKNDFDL